MFSPGLVATLSSLALAVLAGDAVLTLGAAPSALATIPSLYTAGLVMWAVNFIFARLTFAPFYQGYTPTSLVRSEFLDLTPAVLAMLALGVVTAALIPALGVFALALLAAVVVLPQLALVLLMRGRSVEGLGRVRATRLYAAAMADVMALPRLERRRLAFVAELLHDECGDDERRRVPYPEDFHGAVLAAFHVGERWDGSGWPGGLTGAEIPLASRVLAVARAWSELTVGDGPRLPHAEAILDLNARCGREFDPEVVRAASRVVSEEQAFVRAPSFQPRLHRLPFSGPLRHGRIPTVLARLAEPA